MRHATFGLLLITGCCFALIKSDRYPTKVQEYLNKHKSSGYNKRVPPLGNGGEGTPIEVKCSMYILDISDIDEDNAEYRAQFYFRQSWNDSRLSYQNTDIDKIILSDTEDIWIPDSFIVEEKEGVKHDIFEPNIFLRISPTGEVLYSRRVSTKLTCPSMDLSMFPHDVQKCRFTIESYGYTKDKLLLSWDYRRFSPLGIADIEHLPFIVAEREAGEKEVKFTSGEYKRLEIYLTLQRKTGFFWTHLYIPYILLVVMSWVTFWMKPKFVLLRLALLLVILFIMISISTAVNTISPKWFTTKGSDVWMAFCQSMVFASLLEFALVAIISKKKKDQKGVEPDPEEPALLQTESKSNGPKLETKHFMLAMIANRIKRDEKASNVVDKFSKIIFPLLFLLFNIVYWSVYCGH